MPCESGPSEPQVDIYDTVGDMLCRTLTCIRLQDINIFETLDIDILDWWEAYKRVDIEKCKKELLGSKNLTAQQKEAVERLVTLAELSVTEPD